MRRLLDPNRVESVSSLCAEYDVSRKTAYKWRKRYLESGVAGLLDHSRRPKGSRLATSAEMVTEAVRLRRENPRYGPKKLRALLLRKHQAEEVPSVKTIDRILRRCGEPRRKRRVRREPLQKHAPKVEVERPNDLWTIDFKGWWKTGDGTRVYPLTVRDHHSRFVLTVELLESQAMEGVQATLDVLFQRYGLPKAVQSDNGSPFGCTRARGGLTRLSAWLISHGVRVVFSRPGHPQDNGGHERMHLDLRYDVEDNASDTLREERDAAARWVHVFNEHRPHEALGQRTPAELYRPSLRRLLGARRLPLYPASWTTRKVGSPGRISVQGNLYHVGAGLTGHVLGLQPVEGTKVRLWLYGHDLGDLDLSIVTQKRPARRAKLSTQLAMAAK
jgi:transposase InsO family protein